MNAHLELHADGLVKAFPDSPVLRGATVEARAGEVVIISGAPGAGLTTLVRCLTGGYRPDAGTVVITDGRSSVDLAAADARSLAWLRRHHLAVLDGSLPAPPRQPVADAVARAAGVDRPTAVAALDRIGTSAAAEVPIGRIRAPHRRTIALAAALAGRQPLVVLDEPAPTVAVADWIDELARAGRTVVVAAGSETEGFLRCAGTCDAIRHRAGRLDEGVLTWLER